MAPSFAMASSRTTPITMAAAAKGKPAATPAKKPLFSFGGKKAEPEPPAKKPMFSFGGKKDSAVGSKIAKASKTTVAKPSGGFSFGGNKKKSATPPKEVKKGGFSLFGQKPATPPTKGKK